MAPVSIPNCFVHREPAQDADERILHRESEAQPGALHDWGIRAGGMQP